MKLGKKIFLWVIFALLACVTLAAFPSFASITAVIIALLILPIEKWQHFLHQYIKGKLKTITIIILVIAMIATFPSADTPSDSTPTEPSENVPDPTENPTDPTMPPHDHTWENATCTSPKKCTVCEITDGTALEHSWIAANCTTPKTCSVCSTTTGLPAPHNYVDGKCSVCKRKDPSDPRNISVWIPTNGGTKYHSYSGCSSMKNPKEVTLAEAKASGYTACQRCH